MKSIAIAVTIAAYVVSKISAQCFCDPNDTHCINRCVADTNECVSECQSNTECYSRCIEYHWPGLDSSTYENYPTSTWSDPAAYATITPTFEHGQPTMVHTTSTWYESSSTPVWSQVSSWTSQATWSPNPSSSISPSTTPSSNGVSYVKVSRVVVGMTLAAAVYLMH